MIDDHNKAMKLVGKMEAQLPVPARSTTALERLTKEQDVHSPSSNKSSTYSTGVTTAGSCVT
jgi:hypothetical protein